MATNLTSDSTRYENDTDISMQEEEGPSSIKEESHPCLQFLNSNVDYPFSVVNSELCGTTLVANRGLAPGSLLFTLPSQYLVTYERVCATPLSRLLHGVLAIAAADAAAAASNKGRAATASNKGRAAAVDTATAIQISPEELTWLNMIVWRSYSPPFTPPSEKDDDKNFNRNFQIYLQALSKIPPVASSWSQPLQDELVGTNVYAVLDKSGANDDAPGSVSAIKNLLTLLERIRSSILKRTTVDPEKETDISKKTAINILLKEDESLFTTESLSWARGHFLSRRFPNSKFYRSWKGDPAAEPIHHLAGYGGKTSTFIPVLDLMNHSPVKSNTCTVDLSDDGMYVSICTGDLPLESGEELYYCYGEELSNEILLQGYGFCLPDNPNDTVSVRINANTNTYNGTDGSLLVSASFCIGRGGASAIPNEMWQVLAGSPAPVEEGEEEVGIEIGSGDLECLFEYMTSKSKELNISTTQISTGLVREKEEVNHVSDAKLTLERQSYIEMYRIGQREILEELIGDLSLMLEPAE